MQQLVMQPAGYPVLGGYRRARHVIDYSIALTRTGKNYYDSKSSIPAGYRMSTAAEELAIQLGLEKAGQDPRQVEAFNDILAINNNDWHAWQWTETGLCVPEGRDPNKYQTDSHGRKYWARIVLIGNERVGEIIVPQGGGRVIVEWDEVFGLPKTTEDITWPHTPYTTHFWFDENPIKDSTSGPSEAAVGRRACWFPDGGGWCFAVDASYGRRLAGPDAGFRQVCGPLPENKVFYLF